MVISKKSYLPNQTTFMSKIKSYMKTVNHCTTTYFFFEIFLWQVVERQFLEKLMVGLALFFNFIIRYSCIIEKNLKIINNLM